MRNIAVLLGLMFAAPAFLFANDEQPQIVSAQDLVNEPAVCDADETCKNKLKIGAAEFTAPDELHTVRVPIKNVSSHLMHFSVVTAFIKSDGHAVQSPDPKRMGAFEGMARGFIGVISLGASEVHMQKGEHGTIATEHTIKPGETLVVEHQLPYPTAEVVGSQSQVALIASQSELELAEAIKQEMHEEYWKERDTYFATKKKENLRWSELRKPLEQAKEAFAYQSEEYQAAMAKYWEQHRIHLANLERIETNFATFRDEQSARLESALEKQ